MATQIDDLSVTINGTKLNIRVAVLVQTPHGFIFEKSNDGYFFAVGGRIKINETTIKAVDRELSEELEINNISAKLVGIVENFFEMQNQKYHEYNFVFLAKLKKDLDLSKLKSEFSGFFCLPKSKLSEFDIRPKALLDVIKSEYVFVHLINN